MKLIKKISLAFFSIFLIHQGLNGQFYNGHQMTFGKNRVQYNQFYWQYYRFDRFDTYFNEFGKDLAEYTAGFVKDELTRVEKFFDYTLEKRMIFIVFNKLTDFRQTNIGLISGSDKYNIGGVTQILNNKVFIYYQGSHDNLKIQISKAITQIVIHEMLYGNNLRNNITNSTLINLPEWYLEGLYSYVSSNWNLEIENRVKDGILSGKFDKINRVTGENALIAGHSFWHYIADNYGRAVIPNIIYLTRINKNSKTAFLYVLGRDIKDLSIDWKQYYLDKYSEKDQLREPVTKGKVFKKNRRKLIYQQAKIGPSGKNLAYVTNNLGKYKIWLYNLESGKKTKITKNGVKIEQIIDYSYPVLAWHPTGKILTYVVEEKGRLVLYYYNLQEKELTKRYLIYFDKVLDYDFSDNGLSLVLSAVKESQTDIYTYSLTSNTFEPITDDLADDFNPKYIEQSTKIIFSSNRMSDSLASIKNNKKTALTQSLYIYNLKNNNQVLQKLGENNYYNETQPFEIEKNTYLYLADDNGIINRYLAEFDSTISHIDTAVHYRYFTKTYPLSNYKRNIKNHHYSYSSNKLAEIVYQDQKEQVFARPPLFNKNKALEKTPYRKELTSELIKKDSLRNIKKKVIMISDFDTSDIVVEGINDTIRFDNEKVDINNYIFEKEKLLFYNEKYKKDNIVFVFDTSDNSLPKIRIYETSFYINYLVNQVDFNFLNNTYQPYNGGGAVYYNPGLSLQFKLGTDDLFEDYKIVGGIRFSTDFNNNEYLVSFENLKKRWDKQLIFHRNAYENTVLEANMLEIKSIIKTHTHELIYIQKYPFSQVSAFKGSITARYDKSTYLSTNLENLQEQDRREIWSGLKAEYVYDNTRNLGINLYDGTRAKIFGEAYLRLNNENDDLYVLGFDYRHYERIHRKLIWAIRFAGSTSFGKARLLYYLGSIDNWLMFPPNNSFDNTIPVNQNENYAYQTIATNMRGFKQNIRNGNSFALMNTELRWPFVNYFANYPISSAFWNNLQLVGFFDVGTAWAGATPWTGENAYDNIIIERGPIKATLDADRDPIVYGYGFGLRTQLLGYFIRVDWAWGVENGIILPYQFYLSLSLDF